ncbi:S-adenosyl-L-methionine-dependent methyltransferases superfamily protein [Actinidia rufa]|uniref:Methyltransferase n=1 Tax=Actinidia rufa TaxID=165716 RepID=A0A7J0EB04_9ERIC|nr:S-adenosyl-L-methionine-dependent methyltransferases superfamily protein [Actinidia rufa]
MAISVQNLIKERKYPFIFSLFLLLVFVAFLLLTYTESPITFTADFTQSQSASSPPPSILNPPISNPSTDTPPKHDLSPSNGTVDVKLDSDWNLCEGGVAVDYIPCLDNFKAIKALQSRRHMEHRERHCPEPSPRCLIPLPRGYKGPVPWPKSRDMIWFDNVPHSKLVEYKKDQNWVRKSDDYLVFPGGGTQFKDGVTHYINFIEQTLPIIEWGKHTRVILDVGCGVASFGGYLLDKGVITMSFAPKDEHEAQIQFALERGIPATLSVIGTQRLPFPDNAYDLIHCARCRVHWDADGGKPLMELNRILRPGGFFVWSATPVYRTDERDQNVWNAMVTLTESMCWKVVAKTVDASGIGLVIYQKPVSSSCYKERKENNPPVCDPNDRSNSSWYVPLDSCLAPLPVAGTGNSYSWPAPWPNRLSSKPPGLSAEHDAEEIFYEDTKHWSALVSDVYLEGLAINWSNVRNVMDMNAGFGGFAAALIDLPLWVMNVIPVKEPDTLSVIFDRGLIGVYHDWCESFNTYPRTYDLLHSSFLFKKLTQRCNIVDVAVEMDRILRPGGYVLLQDTVEMINNLSPIFRSLHWSITLYQEQFLVGTKGFWRPDEKIKI